MIRDKAMRALPRRRFVANDEIKRYREWRPLMRLVSIAMQDDGFVGVPFTVVSGFKS